MITGASADCHANHPSCCRGAAESLIRGQDGDVSLGWDTDNRRKAAVLCFDEVQVTDPFAAVALKGKPYLSHKNGQQSIKSCVKSMSLTLHLDCMHIRQALC